MKEDPRQSTRELAIRQNVDQTSILRLLDDLGKINKLKNGSTLKSCLKSKLFNV